MLTGVDMSYIPKTTHYQTEGWWRKAVRKAGVVTRFPEESDPIEAMRRIAKAEAECARKKLAANNFTKSSERV